MISFPTLSVKPSVRNFSQKTVVDPVHRVRFASGAVLTRPLFTSVPDAHQVNYARMPNADKVILEAWERDEARYGGEEFNWTNPKDEETYVTHLVKPIKYTIHPRSSGNLWIVDFNVLCLPN